MLINKKDLGLIGTRQKTSEGLSESVNGYHDL